MCEMTKILYNGSNVIYILYHINVQPQIRKSWDSMEKANKKRK